MYIVALIISVCFICGVAFSQEPTIQHDIIEEDDVENKDEIIEEVREQMKDLGATDEEIEKMVEDLIRQLEDAIITDDEDID